MSLRIFSLGRCVILRCCGTDNCARFPSLFCSTGHQICDRCFPAISRRSRAFILSFKTHCASLDRHKKKGITSIRCRTMMSDSQKIGFLSAMIELQSPYPSTKEKDRSGRREIQLSNSQPKDADSDNHKGWPSRRV